MKPWLLLVHGFLVLGVVGATPPTLSPPSELTLNAPWTSVSLEFPQTGNYRLEATGLDGDPVEVVVERRSPGGTWMPEFTNRTLRGSLEAVVEWTVGSGDLWRVTPRHPETRTVVLRLKPSLFANFRDSLKQGLLEEAGRSLPLKKRLELPLGTGGPGLAVAEGPRGEVWVAWLVDGGTGAEVWEGSRGTRLGDMVTGSASWTELTLEGQGPMVVGWNGQKAEARGWTGLDWMVEAAPPARRWDMPQGTFRLETAPPVRVWRATAAGWIDLELPQDRRMDRGLLGATDDGLYALLGSPSPDRSLYRWHPGEGWTALPAPSSLGVPLQGFWLLTSGASSLFQIEGRGTVLRLQSFDGKLWGQVLDLSPLVTRGLVGLAFLPPSERFKTGALVIATDRVTVYDLP